MKKKKITKIAIANRGEVAVRIHYAAKELGISTVLLHSEVDIKSKAYRLCDEKVCIGPAPTTESYLNMERVVQGALSKGCDAIHPGFGFLSENADFAQLCIKNNIQFVGPSPESIKIMGDKVLARKAAVSAGIPVVPGYDGEDQSDDRLLKEAKKIGFPVIVKASGGGGGRGLKISRSEEDFLDQVISAKREASSSFSSDKVFLEKYLDNAKHIEFQIFGDVTGEVFHLYDRECSVQRRHQKIIEEAVSANLPQDIRKKMAEAAVKVAKAVNYLSAGTVEFIFQDGEFFFMEMNTRLQVEHPVTECITGKDLVKAQIKVASGQSVNWNQNQILPQGHSIECRIYAENPFLGGIPSTGKLGTIYLPEGPGRRFEIGFEKDDEITSYYDSMIAKVIVWEETREKAIDKMIHTLENAIVFGVYSNIPFLIEILKHRDFVNGTMTTQFISKYFNEPIDKVELTEEEKFFSEKCFQEKSATLLNSTHSSRSTPFSEYWRGV